MPTNFSLILEQILLLFIIMFIGFFLRKKQLFDMQIEKGLSNLLIYVTLPALIVKSLAEATPEGVWIRFATILGLSALFYALSISLAEGLGRILNPPERREGVFKFEIVFANVGYMGYPVIIALFSSSYLFYAVLFNLFYDLLIWTYGVYTFENSSHFELRSLVNPGIIALSTGLILFLTGIQLPGMVIETLDILGGMTVPLAMLVIGSSLVAAEGLSNIKDPYLLLISGCRLLAVPLILMVILRGLNLPQIMVGITVVLSAMPAAANSVIFAEKFGDNDTLFASEGVLLTTLLSLLTIPAVIMIFNLLY